MNTSSSHASSATGQPSRRISINSLLNPASATTANPTAPAAQAGIASRGAGASPASRFTAKAAARQRAARAAGIAWSSADPLDKTGTKWTVHEEKHMYRLYQMGVRIAVMQRIMHRTPASMVAHKKVCVKDGRWVEIGKDIQEEDIKHPELQAAVRSAVARTKRRLGI